MVMVAPVLNTCTQECFEFEASLNYIMELYLEKKVKNK